MSTKKCTICDEVKTLSDFHVLTTSKDGRQSRCKPCACRMASDWAKANKERLSAVKHSYYLKNKATLNEKDALWRKNNWPAMLAHGKKSRDANPKKEQDRARKYREAHKEGSLNYRRQYREKNRGVVNFWDATRSAAEKNATPHWASKKQMQEFYKSSNELSVATGIRHHVDHIVPLQSKLVCGLHVEHNLQVITATQNMRKSNRTWPDMP